MEGTHDAEGGLDQQADCHNSSSYSTVLSSDLSSSIG